MCFPLHESDKGYRALPQRTLSTHPWGESVNGLKLKYGKSLQTLGSKSGACVPHIRKRKVKLEVNKRRICQNHQHRKLCRKKSSIIFPIYLLKNFFISGHQL